MNVLLKRLFRRFNRTIIYDNKELSLIELFYDKKSNKIKSVEPLFIDNGGCFIDMKYDGILSAHSLFDCGYSAHSLGSPRSKELCVYSEKDLQLSIPVYRDKVRTHYAYIKLKANVVYYVNLSHNFCLVEIQ